MDGSDNVVDFAKAKERKESIEWIEEMFLEMDKLYENKNLEEEQT